MEKSAAHKPKNTFGGVVALAALLTAAPCWAQSTGTAPVASPDSAAAARSDTAAAGRGDSLARQRADSIKPPGTPVPPASAVDSALGTACAGATQGPPDVLLVTFVPTATESERAAVAKQVGGTILGPSQYAPGSWYLQVPGSGYDPAVADRVILLAPVLEVESTRCPS